MSRGNLAEVEVAPLVQFDRRGVQVFRRDFASSYGWWGNLAVVVGRRPPDVSHVLNYRACVVELHKLYPQGIGLITVVNDTSVPSPAGREALIDMVKEVWPMMTAALYIPNATGFKAAVMRSVMGAFIMATGQRGRIKVESSLQAGLPWLSTKMLGAVKMEGQLTQLERGIREFCQAESVRTLNG